MNKLTSNYRDGIGVSDQTTQTFKIELNSVILDHPDVQWIIKHLKKKGSEIHERNFTVT